MSNMRKLLESMYKFAGTPDQKPGDQVRGTDVASTKGKGKKHPFLHKLVGASESAEVQLIRRARTLKEKFQDFKSQLDEYGGNAGYGAAPQSPQGTTDQEDPAKKQLATDTKQITKSLQQLKPTLTAQGGSQPMNAPKTIATMAKVDATPNTDLNNQEEKQVAQFTPAITNIVKNPQLAGQFKQLVQKAGQANQAQQQNIKKQQQTLGTNTPAGVQQQTQAAKPAPGQQPQAQPGQQK